MSFAIFIVVFFFYDQEDLRMEPSGDGVKRSCHLIVAQIMLENASVLVERSAACSYLTVNISPG